MMGRVRELFLASVATISLLCNPFFLSTSHAQSRPPFAFEAASVRAANRQPPRRGMPGAGEITGGPGTADSTRLTYAWVSMGRILGTAFGIGGDQISAPDWVNGDRFDIVANVPASATKEQVNEMMQSLLMERFHLIFHREKKDFDSYELIVAKGGPKLKEAALADGLPQAASKLGTPAPAPTLDQDGFAQLPPGVTNAAGNSNGGIQRMTYRMMDTEGLLRTLIFPLRTSHLVDKTGLTGKYDFKLEYASNADGAAPDLFTALEKQIGLKLEKSTTKLDVIVIDHLDRRPTEN